MNLPANLAPLAASTCAPEISLYREISTSTCASDRRNSFIRRFYCICLILVLLLVDESEKKRRIKQERNDKLKGGQEERKINTLISKETMKIKDKRTKITSG